MLTNAQKREFAEEGYLKIPGVIPQIMIERARHAVLHSIGHVGLGGEDMANNRSAFFCAELLDAPVILDLYNKTPVIPIAESLMGEGNVQPVVKAKPYPRFPLPLGEEAPTPRGHMDGIGSGGNGMAKGVYRRGFTAFAVIYLADVLRPNAGNFTVWPKSHRTLENYFQQNGHEILKNGMPKVDYPEEPIMLTAKAGDLILAHHQIFHAGGPNSSPDVRLAVITRLVHKDVPGHEYDAYTNIWREWPGVQPLVKEFSNGTNGAGVHKEKVTS